MREFSMKLPEGFAQALNRRHNGAEIRGTLGIEKGNKFIKAIRDLSE